MQIIEKLTLIIVDVIELIRLSGAFHLFAIAVALTLILRFSASFWQPKLRQLINGKFFPQQDWFYFVIIAFTAWLLFAAYAFIYGLPVPRVHDENCYLLMGKTFAAGRITNPPHPLWQFFEHFHLINQPTYTAKYPPAQAAFLAIGIILFNQPIIGVWISGVLAAVACFWMLRAFFSLNWSLCGALLFLTHETIFGWSQSYWGGNVAFVGGALCVGSLFRIIKAPKISLALIFGTGITILTNSRPFEGLLTCLPLAVVIIYWFIKHFRESGFLRRALLKFVVPATFVLLINFAWMGYYNWKVTGNALKLPYSLYTEQYDPVPLFLPFSRLNQNVSYRHLAMKAFYEGEIENYYLVLYQTMTRISLPLLALKRNLNSMVEFLGGNFFLHLSFLLFGIYVFRFERKYLFFIAAFFFCLFLEGGATYNANHYYAPFVPFWILTVTASLATFDENIKSDSGRKLIVSFAMATLIIQSIWILLSPQIIGKTLPDGKNSQFAFQKNFNLLPGKHLVLVDYTTADLRANNGRYNPVTVLSWVYNEPDIDHSKVVWVNQMDVAANRQLFDYFNDRHVWILGFDQSNNAKLLSCENLTSQSPPAPDLAAILRNSCPTDR